ncbi:MAG: hypothetical protein KL839_03270 [Rhizobium sp.]|nr:hypothetical protein [Rhizobium sp.]
MSTDRLPPISDGLADALAAMSDTAIELAGHIPGVGKALDLAKSYRSVSDALFVRKIARFMCQFSSLPLAARQAFFQNLQSREDFDRFGEAVLLLLDRSDELEKPAVIGRLFKAAALDLISVEDAKRIGAAVNRAYFVDLSTLAQFEDELLSPTPEISTTLNALGLLVVTGLDAGSLDDDNSGGTYYRLSTYGRNLVKYGLRGDW